MLLTQLKVKKWKMLFYANRKQKKAGVPIMISEKIEKQTLIQRLIKDKDMHHIMIEKINETESWFSEKKFLINKPLGRITKKKREKAQIKHK